MAEVAWLRRGIWQSVKLSSLTVSLSCSGSMAVTLEVFALTVFTMCPSKLKWHPEWQVVRLAFVGVLGYFASPKESQGDCLGLFVVTLNNLTEWEEANSLFCYLSNAPAKKPHQT